MDSSDRKESNGVMEELSEALKEATKEVHKQAEDTEFMRNFQKGQVTLHEFKLVMSSLYFVYEALEEEIERNKENPVFSPLYFPLELHRKKALEEDLEYFYGPQWRKQISFPQSTKNYVERLHHVGRKEPDVLVAHAYTRYLGDLSGGQVLKKIAQKALQLPATGEGLAFFTFDHVTNATKFKQLYRSRMNSLDVGIASKKRILEEAKTAFLLNVKVFEELQTLSTIQNDHITDEPSTLRSRVPKTNKEEPSYRSHTSEQTALFSQFPRWVAIGGCVLLAIMGLYIL
ncbi:PREDICTED: heme oxygenase 1 isoform X2 [Nanorana parkeri]|uniref:heme oxygenase 1 isoform X2 n=1 Tax=Nanorana parkeri TaxID=125878 RepID=UPI000854D7B7|nr:PREDICTED: heme oxygenase 1 isoform X2 [Nanorana parkeri]